MLHVACNLAIISVKFLILESLKASLAFAK
jgi:hypothetical protein